MPKQEAERRNRKKGLMIAFWVHAVLIGFGMYPFLTSSIQQADPELSEAVILVDFTDFSSASSSAAKRSSEKDADTRKKAVKPEPKPQPKPKPIETKPEPVDPIPTSVAEEPEVDVSPSEMVMEPAEEPSEKASSEKEVPAEESGNPGEGTAGNGTGDEGKTDQGEGLGVDDFGGDGIFNRKVIRRGNVKSITEQPGQMVINLCINQQGTVTYAQYNPQESTINNSDIVVRAVQVARTYLFEKDYTAPNRQCGKLTFIFQYNF